ncbi:MAG TPA: hypothetical protein EYN18_06185 [Nitrospirales bacterium]|nr:hypothetical protein [Nitrospirales bacterium]HIO21969.1 hypothetical protein [Nitrospirales bacterium]
MPRSDYHDLALGIIDASCVVCKKTFSRRITFLTGGWSRCSICDQFVHYSCLAASSVKYFKRRPRVCLHCAEHGETR